MFFAVPTAAFSESGIIERIRGARAGSGDAGRSAQSFFAHNDRLRATLPNGYATVASPDGRAHAIFRNASDTQDVMTALGSASLNTRPDRYDFCKPQEIVPRGETRLDGANNNVSLHAQARTARNPSECASSSPRSWPIGYDPRSVHTATSLPPNRSQMAARTATPHVRPSCNDHLAR
jgi:hypothetical protein